MHGMTVNHAADEVMAVNHFHNPFQGCHGREREREHERALAVVSGGGPQATEPKLS